MAPQRWKVPNSIVAVNHIEVFNHIDWLQAASQWACNIYGGEFEPLISLCWFFLRNPILLFFNLIYLPMCGNEQVVIFTPTNVQFENVSFFLKVSNEEKFLLFQCGEINDKSAMLSCWYAWCKNADSW